ncbi:hypothetical protein NX722_28610 [Endozoicomonas gorgoniicola]|uniref:Uncharacterized protein n=1 Tax=Endozoicomonas gorgoniicola TaxID=1234144 RepID=A0ABT3N4A7_9GAMM|nr:hypothetical protein [Endozoicomonas gorgoniicola]MCW7552675.1 hypothetical protein [Endozoicomonas gorgoniicola]MCW7556449.1 hypothetical protein [Endozoicomonas gorgoniicola]MCW7556530.1 hypothetical protein [Endozoicomonas gorgoniicola]
MKKYMFEVWLTIGLFGVAITDYDDPDGALEGNLNAIGIENWIENWIKPQTENGLEVGNWHLKGTIDATDFSYTIDYAMPD